MTWLRRLVLWVVLRGPRLPFWLLVRAMDFVMGSNGVPVPSKQEPTVVTVTAAGRAMLEDGDSGSHRKTLGHDETDTEQWV
jgi:hypothetical protein